MSVISCIIIFPLYEHTLMEGGCAGLVAGGGAFLPWVGGGGRDPGRGGGGRFPG